MGVASLCECRSRNQRGFLVLPVLTTVLPEGRSASGTVESFECASRGVIEAVPARVNRKREKVSRMLASDRLKEIAERLR